MTDRVGPDDRRWVVAAFQRIRKDRRAYSLEELLSILPPPAGRAPNELADMLDQVLALRRLKKAPPRWDLGGEVRMKQPSSQPAGVEVEAATTPTRPAGLPLQKTPRPAFPLGPWRAGGSNVEAGPFSGTWSELLRVASDALTDGYIDQLALTLEQRSGSAPLRIVSLRGLDPLPFFLAYTGVADSRQFSNLAALNWHLWRTESVLSYDNPELALLAPPSGPAVATWRAASPFDLARATCHSLYLLTGLASPRGQVTFVRAPGARRQELDNIERVRRMYSRERKSSSKPVRGHCRACGHALRDAASLRRGYGPDCWERVSDHRRVGIEQAPDLPAHYWAGALPISGLRRRIGDDLRRLVAQDRPN